MSYYSDVAIVFNKQDYNKILAKTKAITDSQKQAFIDATKTDLGDYVVLSWTCYKWYSEIEGVKFIMDMQNEFDSYLIRIGEDFEDIDIEANGDDDCMRDIIDLERRIVITT